MDLNNKHLDKVEQRHNPRLLSVQILVSWFLAALVCLSQDVEVMVAMTGVQLNTFFVVQSDGDWDAVWGADCRCPEAPLLNERVERVV